MYRRIPGARIGPWHLIVPAQYRTHVVAPCRIMNRSVHIVNMRSNVEGSPKAGRGRDCSYILGDLLPSSFNKCGWGTCPIYRDRHHVTAGFHLGMWGICPEVTPYRPLVHPQQLGRRPLASLRAESYSTTTCRTVSLQNGTGHSPTRSVSTSNSSCSHIIDKNQSWASRAVRRP